MQKNADGSVDIYFRADSAGGQGQQLDAHHDPAREFELVFRLYAPTKALFEKSWVSRTVETFLGNSVPTYLARPGSRKGAWRRPPGGARAQGPSVEGCPRGETS